MKIPLIKELTDFFKYLIDLASSDKKDKLAFSGWLLLLIGSIALNVILCSTIDYKNETIRNLNNTILDNNRAFYNSISSKITEQKQIDMEACQKEIDRLYQEISICNDVLIKYRELVFKTDDNVHNQYKIKNDIKYLEKEIKEIKK